jgi:hypothetical protein
VRRAGCVAVARCSSTADRQQASTITVCVFVLIVCQVMD